MTEEVFVRLSSLMYSPWFYPLIAGISIFFLVMLIWGILRLVWHKDSSPAAEIANQQPEAAGDYSRLWAAVGKPNGKPRKLLLAAGSLNDLPVTIPVNIAIQLAASYKCLLIDLDVKRDALAHVFDITSDACTARLSPVPTPLDNLHIWPAHFFSRLRQMDLKTVLAAAQRKYDVILLNAPTLVTHPDRRQILRCAESAVVFARDKKAANRLVQLAEGGSCSILKMLTPDGRNIS